MSVPVFAEHSGRRELGTAGGGRRTRSGYFTDDVLARSVDDAVHAALVNLDARPAPAGAGRASRLTSAACTASSTERASTSSVK
ncbi:hypothetical protein CF642_38170 [Burkholderia pseudomallei]|nr:hypothetical protein CF642_38170 [Burkholderia pseudomallei]